MPGPISNITSNNILQAQLNYAFGHFTGDVNFAGDNDPYLLHIDAANNQVSVGDATPPIHPFRKFYVQSDCSDMTVDGETTGHSAIECRYSATGVGTAAINPVGVYGTLWYHPTANATFSGDGSAVRGNAYTIETTGITCNVTNLIGVYGRARHESLLGTVTWAIAVYSDGAQKAVGAGTITNAAGLFMQPPGNLVPTNSYGLYFNGTFAQGNLFAPVDTDILHVVSGTGSHKFLASNGGYSRVTANGVFEQRAAGANAHLKIVSGTAFDTVGVEIDVNGSAAVYYTNSIGHAQIQTNGAVRFDIDGSGNTAITGWVKTLSTVVGSLPSAASAGAGARAFVTDATSTAFLSVVAGTGANKVPVVSDGANWLIG